MKNRSPVLEYCVARPTRSKKARWSFRFRTTEGDLLLESTRKFGSKAQAERGFISLIKAVATNTYKVDYLEEAKGGLDLPPTRPRRFRWKGRKGLRTTHLAEQR